MCSVRFYLTAIRSCRDEATPHAGAQILSFSIPVATIGGLPKILVFGNADYPILAKRIVSNFCLRRRRRFRNYVRRVSGSDNICATTVLHRGAPVRSSDEEL